MPEPTDPQADAAWDERHRHESETQRLDRNWTELLQELRVVQTGVQLLTGFLLTLPFQQRFADLTDPERSVYLGAVAAAVAATATLVTPVALHRMLFRRHARLSLVATSHRLAQIGLMFLGLAICGALDVIFGLVSSPTVGSIAAVVSLVVFAVMWGAFPLAVRDREH